MSEIKVQRPHNLNIGQKKHRVTFGEPSTSAPKRIKFDQDYKPRRKRSASCSVVYENKKRRQFSMTGGKFLMGGSITDPLNLAGIGKERNKNNKKDSLKEHGGISAVKVIIAPNINDPLNLEGSEEGEKLLADSLFRHRKRRKTRKRKRRNSEPSNLREECPENEKLASSLDENNVSTSAHSCDKVSRQLSCPVTTLEVETSLHPPKAKRMRKSEDNDDLKIVSPVIPKRPYLNRINRNVKDISCQDNVCQLPDERHPPDKTPDSYHPKNEIFKYGNYNKYYGYRNPGHAIDPRLQHLQRNWFEGKDVLDIGCNIGHVSFCAAKYLGASKVIGIDIDKKLINIAKKNLRHHNVKHPDPDFPKFFPQVYGPMPPIKSVYEFPRNIRFYTSNYVLETDELLETVKEEFDVVLCLSVTKWVHLNWGDAGLKRVFHRIYRNLRPQGILILEPQGWPSYKKKRKITKSIFEIFKSIKFFPDQFDKYLTNDVGFINVNKVQVRHNFSKGFQRPLYIYMKPGSTPKDGTMKKSSAPDDSSLQNKENSIKDEQSTNVSEIRKSPSSGENLLLPSSVSQIEQISTSGEVLECKETEATVEVVDSLGTDVDVDKDNSLVTEGTSESSEKNS